MITTARLQRRLRKTNTFLRVARIVTAGLLIVFVGIGVTSAVQRNLLVSVLSFLLALVCAVALSFSIMILRGLPSLNERLGDPDKAQHPNRHRHDH